MLIACVFVIGMAFESNHLASALGGPTAFSLHDNATNTTVNGTYQLGASGCSLYAEYHIGGNQSRPEGIDYFSYNMTIDTNALCVPTYTVTDLVPIPTPELWTNTFQPGGYWMKVT
ncbi:MAG TPA: hypothetical protein VM370_13240, partial [Candidatus Thermoplasmatota archaeon]|nr:hypothetical protein [Candidatus Thermoplasmatota archaeon]